MSYRPKDWDAIKILEDANMLDALFSHRYACEAGADAMLEALKTDKTHINYPISGWLIFIPEEVTETPTHSASDESPKS